MGADPPFVGTEPERLSELERDHRALQREHNALRDEFEALPDTLRDQFKREIADSLSDFQDLSTAIRLRDLLLPAFGGILSVIGYCLQLFC